MNLLKDISEFDEIYNRNVDMVYRICFMYLKNVNDSEDMVQNTFLKYLKYNILFKNLEHEKAWFIVVATNNCKNHFKSYWNKYIDCKDYLDVKCSDEDFNLINTLISLPLKYKQVIYMHYYEGYKTREISELLKIKESTIRTHLSKGREILKIKLGSDL